jgi:hypothetical protein
MTLLQSNAPGWGLTSRIDETRRADRQFLSHE